MPSSRSETNGRDGLFNSTSWTVILDAARTEGSSRALTALSELCTVYWRPLYLFLRRQGISPDDAQDLTQGFFADLIQSRAYVRADPNKGRFRSFLLGALKHFVADARDHDHAQKRGGGAVRVPINEAAMVEAEAHHSSTNRWSADHGYEREWAATLLRRAFDRLEHESALAGKSSLFDSLKFHLSGTNGAAVAYEEISRRIGRPLATLRSDVARLRSRYRAILREEVGATVKEPSQVDEELRYLCQVIAAN